MQGIGVCRPKKMHKTWHEEHEKQSGANSGKQAESPFHEQHRSNSDNHEVESRKEAKSDKVETEQPIGQDDLPHAERWFQVVVIDFAVIGVYQVVVVLNHLESVHTMSGFIPIHYRGRGNVGIYQQISHGDNQAHDKVEQGIFGFFGHQWASWRFLGYVFAALRAFRLFHSTSHLTYDCQRKDCFDIALTPVADQACAAGDCFDCVA